MDWEEINQCFGLTTVGTLGDRSNDNIQSSLQENDRMTAAYNEIKRRRGRPRKTCRGEKMGQAVNNEGTKPTAAQVEIKRSRGRPRKIWGGVKVEQAVDSEGNDDKHEERERVLLQAKQIRMCKEVSILDKDEIIELSPCDGILPNVDLSIFEKIFVRGKVFLKRWMILDEIPSNRYGVVAYIVIEQREGDTQGILYAQRTDTSFARLPEEMNFLDIQAVNNCSMMFNTVYDGRFVEETEHWPSFFYVVMLMRESVSLHDLWTNFVNPNPNERKAWSLGTVGRLAVDILEIIELTYDAGYTFRNIQMSYFRVDLKTRRLFLENASEVVISTELKKIKLVNGTLLHNFWRGSTDYAPLSWHHKEKRSVMCAADCAEVLFYMILDMAGFLTWKGCPKNLIRRYKEQLDTKELPPPLAEYWDVVRRAQKVDVSKIPRKDNYFLLNGPRGGATPSVLNFRTLYTKLQALYKIFGDISAEDAPYDYETRFDSKLWSKDEATVFEMIIQAESLRYKLEMKKADCMSLMARKEFARRIAALSMRERAATIVHDSSDGACSELVRGAVLGIRTYAPRSTSL